MGRGRPRGGQRGPRNSRLAREVSEEVEETAENLTRRGRRRRGNDDDTDTDNTPETPAGPVKLSAGGQRKFGNLPADMKDMPATEAVKARGGGQAQVNMIDKEYQNMTVGELANRAAAGDEKAETAMKMVKQASSKAQKYGRGGH
ncbi:hypothetical protein Val02_28400 [Virgisporangium aliadipatigenens]|uniref:Uncharacterized protein n=1 Tax=Virgisporangium aliadipatigenens TaxID=741659 RepID=A0A8J4DPW6_9ACTN|nr:hypothetical protein [Virgisporangium aliadipatigenens]GIJ45954.1 hypothetical protein Val02_28400 [Virgisporangium aliadipatigenens]